MIVVFYITCFRSPHFVFHQGLTEAAVGGSDRYLVQFKQQNEKSEWGAEW